MMTQTEVVQALYEAMAGRDVQRLLELIDPECVITQDPALPWGGRHVGHRGFGEVGLALTTAIDSVVTTEALFAADGEIIQCGRTRGTVRATGAAFDVPEVHRWKIRGDKVVSVHFALDTQAMLAALAAKGP
jgi:ketosteroid isomerase-like protein